ncbi:MAG: hypothetical protein RLZZ370_583 [Bacteroidota bacterium]
MKKAIIIGATSGIGAALSRELLRHHYRVGVTGIDQAVVAEINNRKQANLFAVFLDSREGHTAEVIQEMTRQLEGLDLMVFSAGIGHLNQGQAYALQNEANEINVMAFTEVADVSWRYFEQQGHGHFVSISSIAGLFGYHKAPAYHAAKSYQINYLEALRQKAFHSGKPIYITDIRPGFVATGMTEGKKLFWPVSAAQAARIIYRHVAQHHDIGYVPGRWKLIAGLLNLLPAWIRKRF